MGGYDIYQVKMCEPELFHRALICCGGGTHWNAGRMKKIGFRLFHGQDDAAVFPEESKRMLARLIEADADVRLTLFANCDRNGWEKAYSDYDNLAWLLG